MCLDDPRLGRRQALALGVGAVMVARRGRLRPALERVPIGAGREIRRRDDWGADLPLRGPLQPEPDVRFLLVHHTAGSNSYRADQVAGQIRQVYAFHTGPQKRWADVCYNFFVDRHGGVWEGRAGSADAPVMADATGGSQGFAQLVCLLGNFDIARPPAAMLDSLDVLLAWLGERYDLDARPGATTSFVSRGSSRWPEGTSVTARMIAAHRDMSSTACPGRYMAPLLDLDVPYRVARRRGLDLPPIPRPPAPIPAPTVVGGDRALSVSWEPPSGPQDLPVTGYRVIVAPGGRTLTTTSTTTEVRGLTNGVAYTVRVAAINAAGRGAESPSSPPVVPATVPGRPARPWVRRGAGSVTVSWVAPTSGGSTIIDYVVTATPGGASCTTPRRSCTLDGLVPGVAYTFTVAARNGVGVGPGSLPSVAVRPR